MQEIKPRNMEVMQQVKIEDLSISPSKKSPDLVDAHSHIWLKAMETSHKIIPRCNLTTYNLIKTQLLDFKSIGGNAIIDCSPYGCGRDGNILKKLSKETGIKIIAVTGFHKEEYYEPGVPILNFNYNQAKDFFTDEIMLGLKECIDADIIFKAGLIKIAFNTRINERYLELASAAVSVSKATDTNIIVHTEKGQAVESIVELFEKEEIEPRKVMLHHLDKRNNVDLHIKLAKKGYYLEYDTFLRPKYNPEENLWPLILKIVDKGYEDSIVVGSDIYGIKMWEDFTKKGGLVNFFNLIISKLENLKIPENIITKIIGGNALRFLNLKRP